MVFIASKVCPPAINLLLQIGIHGVKTVSLWRQLDSRKRTIAAQMGELEAVEDAN
jgi:hypothetical protein